jgi:nitrogen regulatory protein P-II 1
MQLVTAVVQPAKADAVTQALQDLGVRGMTISSVSGMGRQRGHTETYRGARIQTDTVDKVRIEVLAHDEDLDGIIDAIVAVARTGEIGDGKIWAVPLTNVVRVRTGERGPDAID